MTDPLFDDKAHFVVDPGQGELFQAVFRPDPALVSDSTGPTVPPVPAPSPGDRVRVQVERVWTDEEGNTWAEGTIPDEVAKTFTHRIVPPGDENLYPPLGLVWSDEGSNPLADVKHMMAAMEQAYNAERDAEVEKAVREPDYDGSTYTVTMGGRAWGRFKQSTGYGGRSLERDMKMIDDDDELAAHRARQEHRARSMGKGIKGYRGQYDTASSAIRSRELRTRQKSKKRKR